MFKRGPSESNDESVGQSESVQLYSDWVEVPPGGTASFHVRATTTSGNVYATAYVESLNPWTGEISTIYMRSQTDANQRVTSQSLSSGQDYVITVPAEAVYGLVRLRVQLTGGSGGSTATVRRDIAVIDRGVGL